ncbi:MAG: hypothetical protein ACI9XO_004615 [Paraglaciecola sp.]|jgi:hypothetical protein
MNKITFFIALILCFSGTVNAQFLKKLGDKIATAAEKTVEREAEKKARKKNEEVVDSTFREERKDEKKDERKTAFPGLSKVVPAASYAFNHEIRMQITSGKEVMDVDYFLSDSDDFLGIQIKDKKQENSVFTVLDVDKEAIFTYMENDGQKMQMGISLKAKYMNNQPDFDVKATGNTKIILDYNCQEYLMTGEDITANVWVTKEVDIRFPSQFYNIKQKKSKHQQWMQEIDGWMMEMTMVETSKRKPKTTIMNCLSIESSNFELNSTDYSSIGF